MNKEVFKAQLNFEVITALFFEISKERYPSSDKILQIISRVVDPLTENSYERLYIKIDLLNAIRNMVKEVSPTKLFRTLQHRDELIAVIIETTDSLEDELEELEETEAEDQTEI